MKVAITTSLYYEKSDDGYKLECTELTGQDTMHAMCWNAARGRKYTVLLSYQACKKSKRVFMHFLTVSYTVNDSGSRTVGCQCFL